MNFAQMQNPMAQFKPPDPKDYVPRPIVTKRFSLPGKLMSMQWVRGPESLHRGSIKLPDGMDLKQSNMPYSTPILRVVAVGPEVEFYKPGDLVFIADGVGYQRVWYWGDELVVLHQDGLLGKIDPEHEGDLRERNPVA